MILIASGTEEIRRRWNRALEGFFEVHEVSERTELERSMTKYKPSVLLLDRALPGLQRVEDISAIKHSSLSTQIILLVSSPNEAETIRMLKAGGKGYCNKEIKPPLLRKALDVVSRGEIWVERKVIPYLLDELTSITAHRQGDSRLKTNIRFKCFTQRERQIAQLVGNGSCNKEIANNLKISERTVKAHLSAIFRKVNVSDRLQLALILVGSHRGKFEILSNQKAVKEQS